jgi:hypothetical protein
VAVAVGQPSVPHPRPQASTNASVIDLLRKADEAMMRGEATVAKTSCEAVLKVEPENLDALEIMADAFVILRKTDEAIAAYRKVLEIAPSYIVEARLKQLERANEQTDVSGRSPAGFTKPESQRLRKNLLDRLFRRPVRQ